MDEFLARQVAILRRLIGDYRQGHVSLNALIQRIEGLNNVIGVEAWRDGVFPIVLEMEQVNAAALDAKRGLTETESSAIERSLNDLEVLIARLEDAKAHE